MGFFDFVGNALSCIGKAVTSVFRGCCSAIGAVGKKALELLGAPTVGIFRCISSSISYLAHLFGIKTPEETPEELGDRAMQGREKNILPEDYKSNREYIQALREKTTFDQTAFDKLSEEEKIEREALGTSIYVKGIEQDMGMELPTEFLFDIGKLKMTGSQMEQLIEVFKKHGFTTMMPMSQYLHGTPEPESVSKTVTALKEATAKQTPTLSREEINTKILEALELIRNS